MVDPVVDMALKPCRECGKQVSTEAVTCPHCGVPQPASVETPVPPDRVQPEVPSRRSAPLDILLWSLIVPVGLMLLGIWATWVRTETGPDHRVSAPRLDSMAAAPADGLRGQSQTESFVTGVLFVALDYFPGSPATFVQQPRTRKFHYREIPTEPSSTEKARTAVTEVLTKLAASDLEGLVDSARQVMSEAASTGRLAGG